MSIKLGLQIPSYSFGGEVRDIFPAVVAQAQEAEAAGFDTLFLMDHFYQLPNFGQPDLPMLESYTTLAALAASTQKIQLGTLVTGNTYRNPALTAKIATTLDVVSGGRAILGVGAGWYQLEHESLGFEFGTFTDRFERLEEALEIISPMLKGERPTFDGKWYRVKEAINEPRLRESVPIMLGGTGEKKTFGLAAKYADHLNLICGLSQIPQKLAALERRCDEVGRDRSTLETSAYVSVVIGEDSAKAQQAAQELMASMSAGSAGGLDQEQLSRMADMVVIGGPDEVAEQIQTRILDHGVDGVTINLAAHGHTPGVIELAGKAIAPLLTRPGLSR